MRNPVKAARCPPERPLAPRSAYSGRSEAHGDRLWWGHLRSQPLLRSSSGAVAVLGCGVAVLVGLSAAHLYAPIVGVVTLLPVFSHTRRTGLRGALREPSVVVVIVAFYVFVFPLRGLVIAASGYHDVVLAHNVVTGSDLSFVLVVASIGTAALVEAFYLARRRRGSRPSLVSGFHDAVTLDGATRRPLLILAGLLSAISFAGLAVVIRQYGGIQGAQAALLGHSKAAALAGQTGGLGGSAWALFAGPAVWCAAYVAMDRATPNFTRAIFAVVVGVVVVSQLVVFGSRLSALLALTGVWVVAYYSGRPIPTGRILAAIPIAIIISVPIIAQRPGGDSFGLTTVERYSRIASYGVLDTALAVHQEPQAIKQALTTSQRWLDFPAYFVPASLSPNRPNIAARTLDLYVAQKLGGAPDQNTGFPATYVTEWLLYAGWPGVLLVSILLGGVLGLIDRRLVAVPAKRTPATVLCYAFVVVAAFTYYKDGDVLLTAVGTIRLALYLGLLLLVTGVWPLLRAEHPDPVSLGTGDHGTSASDLGTSPDTWDGRRGPAREGPPRRDGAR